MEGNWAKIYRELFFPDWEWYGDTNTTFLFIYLFTMANHKKTYWRGQEVKRGQVLTGLKKISADTGLSIQQARTAINKLVSTGKITNKSTNRFRIITIKNYHQYQQNNKQDNKQITIKQQTDNNQITASKKNKKNKNNNTYRKGYCKFNKNSLGELDFLQIAVKYKVSISDVKDLWEAMELYCGSKGKRYKDYKLALMNWVRKAKKEKKIGLDYEWKKNKKKLINMEKENENSPLC